MPNGMQQQAVAKIAGINQLLIWTPAPGDELGAAYGLASEAPQAPQTIALSGFGLPHSHNAWGDPRS
jgi:hypothetical protein